ncbi:hypothetical protein [Micromonospora sp. NBC_00617]|uniref:hypothetical protein n=1 Tax=Micromonospora sp. NBC_00617 TaxID=2903587 RepID=UPI0030DE74B5
MAVAEVAGGVVQLLTAIMEYRRFLAEQQHQQLMQQRAVTERQLEFAQAVGDRQFDVRSELAEQAAHLDPHRTREVHDQLHEQYRQDAATWSRAADPQWWQKATNADIAEVWRASTAWQAVDPAADMARRAAGERLAESGVRVPAPGGRTHTGDALSRAVRGATERQGHAAGPRAATSAKERSATDGRGPADRSSQQREAEGRRAGADADATWHRAAAADDRQLAGAWHDVRLDAEQGLAPGTDVPAYAEARADHADAREQDFTAEATHHEQMADAAGQTAAVAGQAAAPSQAPSTGAPAPGTAEGRGAQAAAKAYPRPTRSAVGRGADRSAAARSVAGRGRVQPQRVPTRAPQSAIR